MGSATWLQQLAGLAQGSPDGCMSSESASNTWCCFPVARIHRSRNQLVEMGMATLTTTASDSPAKFLLSVPTTLCSTGLKALAPEGGMLPPGDTTVIPLNWKLRLPSGHFGLLMPLNQQAKNRVMCCVR
uniref:Uncharacterized protein n=1 Tax=Equus caballus TaxID=9796 RepID=A0A9L0T0J9_HORSE